MFKLFLPCLSDFGNVSDMFLVNGSKERTW